MLPPHWAADPDRRARLDREARALATLNHPNIAAIYGLEESGPVRALVLELVEGRPLSEILAQGPLPLSFCLTIGRQIADALAAAHARGIVHRDLKPGNIMWCDGEREAPTVKLLDFGLAKFASQDTPSSDLTALGPGQTGTATIVGTPAYMSPEQARGAPVDKRTDIWAFGCVLFEMLTGRPAFERGTVTDTLAAIVTGEPDWTALPSQTPPAVSALLRWCLNKDLSARLHDITDARPALTPADAPNVLDAVKPSRRRALIAGAIGLAAAITAVAWSVWPRAPILTSRDTIVLAEFANTTGDTAFDDTLRHAMATALEQSPFLNILPDERVQDVLRLMTQSPNERVTRALARDICKRENLKAFVAGSIAPLGSRYLIALEAVNGQTGEVLAREQAEAGRKEEVVTRLGQVAARLRGRLGESLASIRTSDLPLERVTTASFDAYQSHTLGVSLLRRSRNPEAIASLKRAVDLDPQFAAAYYALSVTYFNTGQVRLGRGALLQAFDLRDRASAREQLRIKASYFGTITRELDLSREAWEQFIQAYPEDSTPHTNISIVYRSLGEFDKAVAASRESMRVRPNSALGPSNLALSLSRLNQFDEARTVGLDAQRRGFDSIGLRGTLFRIGVATGDLPFAREQVAWAADKPEARQAVGWEIAGAASAGRLRDVAELQRRAAALALRNNVEEETAVHAASAALALAATGKCAAAHVQSGVAKTSISPASLVAAGFALGVCGAPSDARSIADGLVKEYPRGTLENNLYGPVIHAAAALSDNPSQVLTLLERARPFDRVSLFLTQYLRGQALLRLSRGPEALSEFQYILDHRGEDMLSVLYPLAYVGLARAATLSGDASRARTAYKKFFDMWKDADTDLPILREARQEAARLK
jgi:tetratricopeptide (TPR) repeat protein